MGERKSILYKLVTGLGTYWVIAKDPTDAETKITQILNRQDYGFTKDRVVMEIHRIADEISEDQFGITGKFLVC